MTKLTLQFELFFPKTIFFFILLSNSVDFIAFRPDYMNDKVDIFSDIIEQQFAVDICPGDYGEFEEEEIKEAALEARRPQIQGATDKNNNRTNKGTHKQTEDKKKARIR